MRVKAQVGRTWGELVPLQDAHLLTADQPAVASGGGGPVNAPQVGAKGSHIAEVGDNRANASLRSDGDNDGVGACAGDGQTRNKESTIPDVAQHHSEYNFGCATTQAQDAGAATSLAGSKQEEGHTDKSRKRRDPFESLFDFDSFRKRHIQPSCSTVGASSSSTRVALPWSDDDGGDRGDTTSAVRGGQGLAKPPEDPDSTMNQPKTGQGCGETQDSATDARDARDLMQPDKRTASVPLRDIALNGINLNPLRANRLVWYSTLSSRVRDTYPLMY
jgi:hypothetical protein